MTNTLGGGGGPDGFKDLSVKLGPSITDWIKNMDKHRYQPSKEHFEQINESVKKYALEKDLGRLEKERDEVLVQFLALKREASSLNSGMAFSQSVCNEKIQSAKTKRQCFD